MRQDLQGTWVEGKAGATQEMPQIAWEPVCGWLTQCHLRVTPRALSGLQGRVSPAHSLTCKAASGVSTSRTACQGAQGGLALQHGSGPVSTLGPGAGPRGCWRCGQHGAARAASPASPSYSCHPGVATPEAQGGWSTPHVLRKSGSGGEHRCGRGLPTPPWVRQGGPQSSLEGVSHPPRQDLCAAGRVRV